MISKAFTSLAEFKDSAAGREQLSFASTLVTRLNQALADGPVARSGMPRSRSKCGLR